MKTILGSETRGKNIKNAPRESLLPPRDQQK